MKQPQVRVIGAGLAGSEAAYQLAKRGYHVELVEMRPVKMTPAHVSENFAELVCSNSFRSDDITNAVGLLKQEMRMLDSIIMRMGEAHRLPAGSALAVDRVGFSEAVSEEIRSMENITISNREITELDDMPTIVATGPLTSDNFSKYLMEYLGQSEMYFYDAIAPIVSIDGVNFDIAYRKSRYDKGDGQDYINCPMDRDQFDAFYRAIMEAEQAPMRDFEDVKVFEGCMPVEEMAKRGIKTMLFGPLKPVGLERPDGTRPYAVVQLRQDDAAGSLYNLVGFQTRLKWGDQKRIIQMIPGLENAEIVRYGVMHRNTYLKSPLLLNKHYQYRNRPSLFFAGQVSGVEGYVESAASGLFAALNMMQFLEDKDLISLSQETVMGSMAQYISSANPNHFQPMNANFGLVANRLKDREAMSARSVEHIKNLVEQLS
ncbi:methylenetetrahydrofolate--tRNA-(uracil(54)-C(5))-methyltransferase (FADH(2)-oxidizing) TrmFO [Erysipelothrix sp. HDW6C]|uniref:methylenetetrahydrofolate--tRNA-(uracil(54)- C(5))-methyltransferase (FADH(2)-oxidizing) TrmFO n=1 Tax=Erysipelothrix sp. HDW6C TaxID=2714930 RepID=UPI001409813B|nr:methylenetetrahydrofolate--tRNA-(uracil(54)-C(5))-methyltransferase (FADH(2)-oxidizing) TrmFO [Erysipelothrix sp. HDW6C]QIK70388.1 methylenetetrahydrofolate--tRNA-(uracil(54)-C(5))-methyltransferase (FADH(2)-oxidizing) TrmFO [Erysipelothrix sp. HDW6C]